MLTLYVNLCLHSKQKSRKVSKMIKGKNMNEEYYIVFLMKQLTSTNRERLLYYTQGMLAGQMLQHDENINLSITNK